jgi:glycosyltransferase involved in cell wall biosynthesis
MSAGLASIVVVNFNYARFLAQAIDSALHQRDAAFEVIVVDDGSTDGSRAVIAGYGSRVRPVLQDNLGQAGAFNAGLARATGEVVIFLDADDLLAPDLVSRVMAAFAGDPQLVRVAYRLTIVDEQGRPTGELMPARDVALPAGDVRRRVLDHGDDLAWPPTSGNAFAAHALRRVMPLPVTDDRIDADAWLHSTIPLLGRVAALDDVGGAYRAHGTNFAFRGGADAVRSRRVIAKTLRVRDRVAELSGELGYGRPRSLSVTVAAHRLVSLRLGGPGHPVAGDATWRAARDGIRAAWGRDDVGVARALAYTGWFCAAAVAPRAAMGRLADAFFVPAHRPPGLRRALAARPAG